MRDALTGTEHDPEDSDEEFYVCMVCDYEAHPDKFGRYCPSCGTDLDELDRENGLIE